MKGFSIITEVPCSQHVQPPSHCVVAVMPTQVCVQLLTEIPFTSRKAHKRPASAAVQGSAAAAGSTEDVTGRPAPLPVSHWSSHHHHYHTAPHPHLRQDFMSSMHFSRPKSAQPQSPRHRRQRENDAVTCSSLVGRLQPDCAEGASTTAGCCRQQERSHAGGRPNSVAACSAGESAASDDEAVGQQACQAAVDSIYTPVAQQHLEQMQECCQPEGSPEGSRLEAGNVCTDPCSTSGMTSGSMQQAGTADQPQAGRRNRARVRKQQHLPDSDRWRSASLFKLPSQPMHIPTPKVRKSWCLLCGLSVHECILARSRRRSRQQHVTQAACSMHLLPQRFTQFTVARLKHI